MQDLFPLLCLNQSRRSYTSVLTNNFTSISHIWTRAKFAILRYCSWNGARYPYASYQKRCVAYRYRIWWWAHWIYAPSHSTMKAWMQPVHRTISSCAVSSIWSKSYHSICNFGFFLYIFRAGMPTHTHTHARHVHTLIHACNWMKNCNWKYNCCIAFLNWILRKNEPIHRVVQILVYQGFVRKATARVWTEPTWKLEIRASSLIINIIVFLFFGFHCFQNAH